MSATMRPTPPAPPIPPSSPLVRAPGSPGRIAHVGVTVNTLVRARETGGAWALVDYVVPAGFAGPRAHRHAALTETFHCVAGAVTMTLDGREVRLTPGDAAVVPPGVAHAFANHTGEDAKLLILLMPGGFEGYFDEVAELAAASPTWPPADRGALDALAARYDLLPAE